MSSTKSQILIAVVLVLISITIFLAFTDSQAHRLQLLSFSLPRPLRSLNSSSSSSSSSSSCGGVAVNGRPPPLKVFMYDLPRRFNFEMVDHRPEPEAESRRGAVPPWPEKSGVKRQHSVEYWLTASLMVNGTGEGMEAVRVFDGDQAEVFFVPFFSSLSFNTHGRTMTDPATEIDRQLQIDLLDFLRKSKYWQRSAGRDHIIPMHHPNAFRFLRDQVNASILVVVDFGRYPRSLSFLSKDVVTPYVHVVDTYTDDNSPDPFESRPTLLFFRGRTVRKDEGIVRKKLAKILKGFNDVRFEDSFATGEGIKASSQGMRSSKFCLHPAGDTPSSCRLFDAIVSHCVPVIISDHIELPFESELDYSEFSLFFSVSEALQPNHLVTKLREVTKERWVEMWAKLKNVSHHFEFQYPPKPGDGINMLWRQVRHKIPSARLAVHRSRRLKIPDWWNRRRR